jgi:hypothetical protein
MPIIESVVKYEGESLGLFMNPVVENPLITALGFDNINDHVVDNYVYLNTQPDKVTKARAGCGLIKTGDGAAINRKKFEPNPLQVYLEQCPDVFDQTIFAEARKRGVDVNDLTGTELERLLIEILAPVITRDALRILLLGDKALSDTNYNQIDGIYKVLKAGEADGDIINTGNITDTDLEPANIFATLKKIKDNSDRRLKQQPRGETAMLVTQSVYDAWEEYLITKTGLESSKTEQEGGIGELRFMGIPLVPLHIVDEYLAADFAAGSPPVVANPHRVIYTRPDNHLLGLDTLTNWNEIKFWYSDDDDINKSLTRYNLSYEYKYGSLITIAGF